METKVNETFMRWVWQRLGFQKGVAFGSEGLSRGICLFWREEMNLVVENISRAVISGLVIPDDGNSP